VGAAITELASGILGSFFLSPGRRLTDCRQTCDSGRLRRGYFLGLGWLVICQGAPPRESDPLQASGQRDLLNPIKLENKRTN
jgi:hypothetical protein